MKKVTKVILCIFLMSMFFTVFTNQNVVAEEEEDEEIDGDKTRIQIEAHNRTRLHFRGKTEITIDSDVDIDAEIDCEAKKIGKKDFEITIEGDEDLKMEMTCTEEQKELGLEKGELVQTRNQKRYRYQEGFVVEIETDEDCDAELKLEETKENKKGTWAYYDENDEEWVPVETKEKDGYLVAETDHFSTWTILLPEPEPDYTPLIIIGIIIGVIVLVAITIIIIVIKKKQAKN